MEMQKLEEVRFMYSFSKFNKFQLISYQSIELNRSLLMIVYFFYVLTCDDCPPPRLPTSIQVYRFASDVSEVWYIHPKTQSSHRLPNQFSIFVSVASLSGPVLKSDDFY
jgi:hypothetical protein